MNTLTPIIQAEIYAKTANIFIDKWVNVRLGLQSEIVKNSTPYSIFYNIGMAYRLSGERKFLKVFDCLPQEDIVPLIERACIFITDMKLQDVALNLYSQVIYDKEAMDLLERFIAIRDEVEVVSNTLLTPANKLLLDDKGEDLIYPIMKMVDSIDAIDRCLLNRPDIIFDASKKIKAKMAIFKDIDDDRQWWFKEYSKDQISLMIARN